MLEDPFLLDHLQLLWPQETLLALDRTSCQGCPRPLEMCARRLWLFWKRAAFGLQVEELHRELKQRLVEEVLACEAKGQADMLRRPLLRCHGTCSRRLPHSPHSCKEQVKSELRAAWPQALRGLQAAGNLSDCRTFPEEGRRRRQEI